MLQISLGHYACMFGPLPMSFSNREIRQQGRFAILQTIETIEQV